MEILILLVSCSSCSCCVVADWLEPIHLLVLSGVEAMGLLWQYSFASFHSVILLAASGPCSVGPGLTIRSISEAWDVNWFRTEFSCCSCILRATRTCLSRDGERGVGGG